MDPVFSLMRENPSFVAMRCDAMRDANAARINEQRAQLELGPLPAEVFVVGSLAASE